MPGQENRGWGGRGGEEAAVLTTQSKTPDSRCLAAPSPLHLLGPLQHPDLIWSRSEKISCVSGLDPPLPMREQDQRREVTCQSSHS